MNHEDFIRSAKRRPIVVETNSSQEVTHGIAQIHQMIPHRAPMLLVDRISMVDLPALSLRAHRRIDPADPVLSGHFPDYPVYPGALLLESMGQAALCLHHMLTQGRVHIEASDTPRPVRLLRILHGLFQGEVRPGDELTLLAKRLESEAFTMTCGVQALKGKEIVSLGLLEVYLVDEEE